MKNDCFAYKLLSSKPVCSETDLVIYTFNNPISDSAVYNSLRTKYPSAEIVMFSTAGHFHQDIVMDDNSLVTTFNFESSTVKGFSFECDAFDSNYGIGKELMKSIDPNAKALFLIGDGMLVDGSNLIEGINDHKTKSLDVFGGLAGDGGRYGTTYIGLNENPKAGRVVGIAFSGDKLKFESGHDWGWSSLGLEYKITKSNGHELFEINNQNAYDTLLEFMGEHLDSAFTSDNLYYPFFLVDNDDDEGGVIRTPIRVNHEKKSLIYAGKMPEGSTVKLMKTGTMQLLDSIQDLSIGLNKNANTNSFVFAISCIGRRIILNELANEEFNEMNNVFGNSTKYLGFYSYGEFTKTGKSMNCKMHNQTLVLGVLSEG